jgi:hypothetical protein
VAADPYRPRQVGKQVDLEFFRRTCVHHGGSKHTADGLTFIQVPPAAGVESLKLPISWRWGSLAAVIDAPCDAKLPRQRACSVTLWVQARKIFARRGATLQWEGD